MLAHSGLRASEMSNVFRPSCYSLIGDCMTHQTDLGHPSDGNLGSGWFLSR